MVLLLDLMVRVQYTCVHVWKLCAADWSANRVLCIFLLGASKIKDTHFPRCTYFASTVSPLFSNQRMTHWCTLCRRATFHTADCQMSQPFWFLTRLESLCTAEFTCRKVQIWAQPATLRFVLSIQLLKILPLDFDPPPPLSPNRVPLLSRGQNLVGL